MGESKNLSIYCKKVANNLYFEPVRIFGYVFAVRTSGIVPHLTANQPLNATLFCLTVETVSLSVLACLSSAFLVVRCGQPKTQSAFLHFKG